MLSTPMIIDLDPAGSVEEKLEIEVSKDRSVKRHTVENSKSLMTKPEQKDNSQHSLEACQVTPSTSLSEKGESTDRRSKNVESKFDRSYDKRQSRPEFEKQKGEDKTRRVRSMPPDRQRPVEKNRELDERCRTSVIETQPSRWSEDPQVYRECRGRYEHTDFQHAYSERELHSSTSVQNRREESSFRGRPVERSNT
jgi:hypothetical protein